MIGINECNTGIAGVAKQHFDGVKLRVGQNIDFYVGIFKYLESIAGKHISDSAVQAEVQRLKTLYRCDHCKSLLNHFLKDGSKIENVNGYHLIRPAANRKPAVHNLPAVLSALKELKKRYVVLLTMDFNNNVVRNENVYQAIKTRCADSAYLQEKIFDYDWFTKLAADKPWGSYQLTNAIGLSCCPYCNRQYTFTISVVGGKKVARPQLDHFLPQKYHPLLALSFYNLIPSCAVCNASIKGSANTSYKTHISPYLSNPKHALMRFSYRPQSYTASVGLTDDLIIDLKYNGDPTDSNLKKKVDGNIGMFFLEKLYENHKDEVKDIIFKRKQTNDQYLKMTQKTFRRLNLTEADAYRIAYGKFFEEIDFHYRPLSKLTKDIAYELGALIDFPVNNP